MKNTPDKSIQTKSPRKRYDYLDIAKAITIFLVIVGHTTGNLDTPRFRLVLYAFHMPLFFMVSGVVIRTHRSSGYGVKHWLDFFRKNILALAVPYFVWAVLYSHFSFENLLKLLYGSWERIGETQTVTSLWFLTCLFVARILMELTLMSSKLFKKLDRHLYAAIIAVPAFAVGFLLPHPEHGYPWNADIAFVALGFMLAGYSIKEWLAALHEKSIWVSAGLFAVCAAIFSAVIALQGDGLYLALMCKADYGNVWLFLLQGFSGSGMILFLSTVISKLWAGREDLKVRKATLWIGKNTIGIYLLHKPFLQEIAVKGAAALGLPMPNVFTAVLCSIVTLPVCCLAIMVIDRYIPQLFGKFPKPEMIAVKEPLVPEEEQEPDEPADAASAAE